MPRRIKTLLIMETVALAGTVTWILILLFGVELPPSPYQSVNTCPDVTFRMITPYISILNQASTFELANTGGDPYAYGNDFRLEARIDGVWRVIPHDGWAIEDIGYDLTVWYQSFYAKLGKHLRRTAAGYISYSYGDQKHANRPVFSCCGRV